MWLGIIGERNCISVQLELEIFGTGEDYRLIRCSRSCKIDRAWQSGSPYPSWVDASGNDGFSKFPSPSR